MTSVVQLVGCAEKDRNRVCELKSNRTSTAVLDEKIVARRFYVCMRFDDEIATCPAVSLKTEVFHVVVLLVAMMLQASCT